MYKREILTLLQKFNARVDLLANYTTYGIGGRAVIVLPKDADELIHCVSVLEENKVLYKVIGNGSNLLAPSKGSDLVIICTRNMDQGAFLVKNIPDNKCIIKVPSGTNINQFILWCANAGLAGLESLYGIPATVGGMVVMNAGAFGTSIFDALQSITFYENGEVKTISAKGIKTGYHSSELLGSAKIVLDVTFKLEKGTKENILSRIKEVALKRAEKQPQGKSAGSVFKNPELAPAGRLIEESGFKGERVGKAFVSKKHANFIISEGATDKQVKKLIIKIQKKVEEKFGILLEREIEYIGEADENNR